MGGSETNSLGSSWSSDAPTPSSGIISSVSVLVSDSFRYRVQRVSFFSLIPLGSLLFSSVVCVDACIASCSFLHVVSGDVVWLVGFPLSQVGFALMGSLSVSDFAWSSKAEGSVIQSPLLLLRATVQIFPGEKCRLCFSPFHSGTNFTREYTRNKI